MTIICFLLPAFLIYTVFLIVPMLGGVFFSVVNWNGIAGSSMTFTGLDNYIGVLKNKDFLLSLQNMMRMLVISVIFHTPTALLIAVVINTRCRGYRLFKAIYFVPTVFPMTAVALMWYFIFMPNGTLNAILELVGLERWIHMWLVEEGTAMNTLIFVNVWAGIGYYMIIILAGLTTIPEDLYEAAAIDGASAIQKFRNITVPMLRSTLVMCVVLDIIGTIKIFDLVFSLTGGGPNGLTNLPTTLLYNEAFKYSHYGAGSAIGIIIMVICMVCTIGTNKLLNEKQR